MSECLPLQLQHHAITMQNTAQTAHREINKYLFVDYVNLVGFLSKRVPRKRISCYVTTICTARLLPLRRLHMFEQYKAVYQIHVTVVRGIAKRSNAVRNTQ